MFNFKRYDFKNFSFSLLIAVLMLCAIGAFCIFKSDGIGMARRQVIGMALGITVIAVVCLMDYHIIVKLAPLYYLVALVMLVLVRFSSWGVDHETGKFRWLNIKVAEIQPSELVKIIMIIVMAVLFSKLQNKMNKWWVFLLSIFIMALPTGLILIQTDLSSSMVCVFIFVIMIFMAGLSMKITAITLAVGIPVSALLFWYVQQPFQILLTDEQRSRILSFLRPEEYASTGKFQQINSVQAIASGQVLGKTLLNDPNIYRRYNLVYVNESDFIFSVVGEELGFIGCFIVILLFAFIVFKCILIAKKAGDFTGKMIAVGVSAMFMFQSFVNIGVATDLLPNTGLPLPFLSYGLSSLLSNMLAVALVLNVGLQTGAKRGLSFNTNESEVYF